MVGLVLSAISCALLHENSHFPGLNRKLALIKRYGVALTFQQNLLAIIPCKTTGEQLPPIQIRCRLQTYCGTFHALSTLPTTHGAQPHSSILGKKYFKMDLIFQLKV